MDAEQHGRYCRECDASIGHRQRCGAGTDLLIAAQVVGPHGRVIGVDMTPAMLDRARQSATEMGLENVELHRALLEACRWPTRRSTS